MAALRDVLAQFVSEVFASTHFDQQILLRGVYFTSGTQDGTPVDRLLGAIGRRFGVAPDAVAPASGPGKAYFVERLLKDVMIGESGLAGVNRRLEARKAAAQLGAYAAMALIAVLWRDRLVGELQPQPCVPCAGRGRHRRGATSCRRFRRRHRSSGCCPASMRYAPSSIPPIDIASDTTWAMRWGLYQGGSIGNSARDAYVRELDGMLLAAGGGAHQGPSGRVRLGAGEARTSISRRI